MGNTSDPTRCAFIVCKVLKCGKPHFLFVRDEVWGDLTLVGGHEEPGDACNLDRTAQREVEEELGRFDVPFRLIPLTEEIRYGPAWSVSAQEIKNYVFKYYGIKFGGDPKLKSMRTDKGFVLELVEEDTLPMAKDLSNVVKILLSWPGMDLRKVPVSWEMQGGGARAGCRAEEAV